MLAQGGVKLDGEPLAADCSTCPRERSTARVLQVGKRHFRARCASAVTVHTGLLRLETEGDGADRRPHRGRAARSCGRAACATGVVRVFVTGLDGRGDDDGVRAGRRARPARGCSSGCPRRGRGDYAHNVLNRDDNAHAHLRASLIGPSETVPLVAGGSCSGPGSRSS